jgi:tetratricopeptide (TPR) repeat protein
MRRYFLDEYREGADPEELRGYVLERIDTGTYVWTHAESHISVWSEVVNLAPEDSSRENVHLLFHYCSRAAFGHVTKENRKDEELFASLVETDSLFGAGIYSSVFDPASFGSRKTVVDNMFMTEMEAYQQEDSRYWTDKAAFSIPMLVPASLCVDVRTRATPEMVWGKGRDKHGGTLHPGRDLWVVRIKDEPRYAHNAAVSYEAVLRRRLVRHESSGARERAVQDLVALGRHLRRRGRHQEALQCFEKALTLNISVYGKEHPSVATSYNEMAVVYHRNCQYAQALEYYEMTLKIQIASLGKAHPHVASTYNNIAVVHGRQSNHEKALEYYAKAQEIKLETLGQGHLSVAATHHNMANVYRRQNNYAKALEYYGKALQIRLARLGDTHPSVGDTYYNMGMLYRWMEGTEEVGSSTPEEVNGQGAMVGNKALMAFRAAYKAYLETYGPDNQETRDAKQQMQAEQKQTASLGGRDKDWAIADTTSEITAGEVPSREVLSKNVVEKGDSSTQSKRRVQW